MRWIAILLLATTVALALIGALVDPLPEASFPP
jgi:hypothetical protein